MLYLIVGVFTIVVSLIFAMYHRAVARPKGEASIAQPKFKTYFLLAIPPAAQGLGMALVPVMIADIFVAVVITGKLFDMTFYLYDCKGTLEECPLTIFDNIKDDPAKITVNYLDLRTGRCGTCFLIVGVYLMAIALSILVPDQQDKSSVPESYDGNVWEYYAWKRSNMIFVSLWLIFLSLSIIQFSFSDLFGNYIW